MTELKVAKVIDKYAVALNRGQGAGIVIGNVFDIVSADVIDPETGESLGRYPKLRVQVTEVHERFCIAETFRKVNRNASPIPVQVGDSATLFTRGAWVDPWTEERLDGLGTSVPDRSWIQFDYGLSSSNKALTGRNCWPFTHQWDAGYDPGDGVDTSSRIYTCRRCGKTKETSWL